MCSLLELEVDKISTEQIEPDLSLVLVATKHRIEKSLLVVGEFLSLMSEFTW